MTHQRPKTDGVGGSGAAPFCVRVDMSGLGDAIGTGTGELLQGKPPTGITDLTNAVDSRSAAVKAAEDFAACEIRCHLLHGQLLAELGRLKELSYALDRERADAVIRVQAIAVPTVKSDHD